MEEKRFTLRMDGELFEEISKVAEQHRRSVAKEIESAIAFYLYSRLQKEFDDSVDRERLKKGDDGYAKEIILHNAALKDKYKVYE